VTSLSPSSMADVAARAGVSVSTVSRSLRGSDLVSAATADRVRQAAEELDFAVSRAASSLASGRLNRVAVLLSGSLSAWFNGSLLEATYAALHDRGQELLIYRTRSPDERDAFFATLPARRNADAMIVASMELTAAQRQRLQNLGMPLVFVNQRHAGATSVAIDDAAGAEVATQHLINLGHRRVAFVGYVHDPAARHSSARRQTGYRTAMAAARIPAREQRAVLIDRSGDAEEAVSQLLGASRPPTAVLVESDDLAMRVLAALWRIGLRTPADLSVVGFDGHAMAETFGLTTIAQPVAELGRQAAELALTLAAKEAPRRRTVTLPTNLVLRSTTGRPGMRRT
jgi:LacI family transcriptional regulator, repressor for deo operon, udp, cdd, tsx, nupC, and nupG